MSQLINIGDTEVVKFNGQELNILQLNGKPIWIILGIDFNYTGLDSNGNLYGTTDFDGTIVAYAVGKPIITLYKQVSPTPTTQEGYYGYYHMYDEGDYRLIDESNFLSYDIQIGDVCYETTQNIEVADGQTIEYPACNGYNSEMYGGYDFSIPTEIYYESVIPYDDETRIVSKILKIPSFNKGLPVTTILDKAFLGLSVGNPFNNCYQARFINDIIFGENITRFNPSSLANIFYYGVINSIEEKSGFYVPNGTKYIDKAFDSIGYYNESFYKIILPESVEYYKTGTSTVCKTVIIKSENITIDGEGLTAHDEAAFKKSVNNVSGCLFGSLGAVGIDFIFEHSDEDNIVLNITSSKTAENANIYTDNTYIRNYDWASKNITPTFYSLSEYTGELE